MAIINVLWAIDHVCYDGSLHGGGRLFWNILSQFDRDRFRIVPCMLRANDTLRNLFQDAPVPVQILDKGKFDPTTLNTFLRLIRQENIQVMHLHCYGSSTFGRLAGLIKGIPTIIHDYDTEVYFPYPGYLKLADRLLAPSTKGAVAASPMVKRFLVEKRDIDESKIQMMFHAIPDEKFKPVDRDRRAMLRQQLGLNPETKVLGTVTKLGPQRGNELLIEAFAKVAARSDSVLVINYQLTRFHRLPSKDYVEIAQADLDDTVNRLRILAEKLGIGDRVYLIERAPHTEDCSSILDIFIAPFLSERFSSVHLLEAMAQGQPVIATNLGEQREIIDDGDNGYLIPIDDADTLAKKALDLLQPKTLSTFGDRARARAKQYSIQSYVARLQDYYAKLVINSATPSQTLTTRAK